MALRSLRCPAPRGNGIERALHAARMEVNAAMLDAMDHHVGRFVAHLKANGQYDNTIFVVASDNGPEPSSAGQQPIVKAWMWVNDYHMGPENIGERGSWGFIGPEWANAAASPGALYKFYATEGGIRAPLIIAGPDIAPSRIESPAMVTDIAPTLLEWIDHSSVPARAKAMTGRSLLPVLQGEVDSVYRPDDIRAIEVSGNSALYKGDYKITRSMAPVGDGEWRLFNMALDPGETVDLGNSKPKVLADMLTAYSDYEDEMGVLPMPEGYDSIAQVQSNVVARILPRYGWHLALAGIMVLLAIFGLWRGARQLVRRKTPQV